MKAMNHPRLHHLSVVPRSSDRHEHRRHDLAFLFVRCVRDAADPRRSELHLVNLGAGVARDASWRFVDRSDEPVEVQLMMVDPPGRVITGADYTIAALRHDNGPATAALDVIVRWTQPTGTIEESFVTIR
jgi:hypothetical protein